MLSRYKTKIKNLFHNGIGSHNNQFKNKTDAIMWHLKHIGPISQAEATELYGLTRLSGLIFSKKKQGHKFVNIDVSGTDRFGKTFGCVKYQLIK